MLLMHRRAVAGRSSPAAALLTLSSTLPALPPRDSSPVGVRRFTPSPRSASKAMYPLWGSSPRTIPGQGWWGASSTSSRGRYQRYPLQPRPPPFRCSWDSHFMLELQEASRTGRISSLWRLISIPWAPKLSCRSRWQEGQRRGSGSGSCRLPLGDPSGSKQMGGVRRRSRPSWFSEPGSEGETRYGGCDSLVWI